MEAPCLLFDLSPRAPGRNFQSWSVVRGISSYSAEELRPMAGVTLVRVAGYTMSGGSANAAKCAYLMCGFRGLTIQ
jgi:hypothetical protein